MFVPPFIPSGDSTIVPASGFELITSTRTEIPAAMYCSSATLSVGARRTEVSVILDGADPVVVTNFGPPHGPRITTAEGETVTVPLSVTKPAVLEGERTRPGQLHPRT